MRHALTDSEPIKYSAPPSPRNDCEAAFLKDLTADIGIALSPPPTPQTDAVVRVMNACTGDELLAADDYLAFAVGGMMARLEFRALFSGPGPETQLVDLCRSEPYHSTLACRTQRGA